MDTSFPNYTPDDHPQQPIVPPLARCRRVHHNDGTVERFVDPQTDDETIYQVGMRRLEWAAVTIAVVVISAALGFGLGTIVSMIF